MTWNRSRTRRRSIAGRQYFVDRARSLAVREEDQRLDPSGLRRTTSSGEPEEQRHFAHQQINALVCSVGRVLSLAAVFLMTSLITSSAVRTNRTRPYVDRAPPLPFSSCWPSRPCHDAGLPGCAGQSAALLGTPRAELRTKGTPLQSAVTTSRSVPLPGRAGTGRLFWQGSTSHACSRPEILRCLESQSPNRQNCP